MPRAVLALAVVALTVMVACGARPAKTTIVTKERDAPLKKTEGAIGGVVRDSSDGMPLSMVMVQAELDGKVVAEDVSDYKGAYRLGPLGNGHYKVTAKFANAKVLYEDVVVHEGLETEIKVAIDLRPQGDRTTTVVTEGELGTIKGVVLDGVDGASFPGTVVSLHAKHLSEAVMSIADDEGRFRFRSLRPGVYSLSCYYQLVEQGNIEIRRGNIVVEPGGTTDVQLALDLDIR